MSASSNGANRKWSPNHPLRLFFIRLSRYKRDDALEVAPFFADGRSDLFALDDFAVHVHLDDLALRFRLVARMDDEVVHRQAASRADPEPELDQMLRRTWGGCGHVFSPAEPSDPAGSAGSSLRNAAHFPSASPLPRRSVAPPPFPVKPPPATGPESPCFR